MRTQLKDFTKLLMLLLAMTVAFTACDEDDPLSNEAEITSFVFDDLNPSVTADISGASITANVPDGTDLTSLSPTITVSEGATVDPASGSTQDFTNPVTYTVTAEDGVTTTSYTVTVTEAESSQADIVSFEFQSFYPAAQATINGTDVTVTIPPSADPSSLTPFIEVSEEATIDPATEVEQDFSSPVTYTVTAEDGTTQTYTVTVVNADPILSINTNWAQTLAEGGVPPWFTSDNDRDVALGPDYIYAHNNNDKIRVLSKADGSLVSAGPSDFIDAKQNFTSGNLFLLSIDTDVNGVLLGANLRVGANPWYVYKWNNKDADQELFVNYPNPEGWRLGENLCVRGDVTADAFIYTPVGGFGAQNDKVLRFDISGGVAESDNPTIITLQGIENTGNAPDVWAVDDTETSDLIIGGTGVSVARFNADGTKVGELPAELNVGIDALLFGFAMDVAYFELGERDFVIAEVSDGATTGKLAFIDVTDGFENVTSWDVQYYDYAPADNQVTNANATGGVDVRVDGTTAHVAGLITNFGVGYFDVTLP